MKKKTLEEICKEEICEYAEEDKFNKGVYKCGLTMYKICLYKDYKKCDIFKYCAPKKHKTNDTK